MYFLHSTYVQVILVYKNEINLYNESVVNNLFNLCFFYNSFWIKSFYVYIMKVLLIIALIYTSSAVPYDLYVRNGSLLTKAQHKSERKWYSLNNETINKPYIVGGTIASLGEVPSIVSLIDRSHFCGGSIYDEKTIITAAHCVSK